MTHTLNRLWHHEITILSRKCGGVITVGDTALACIGCASAVFLVVAWGFLILIVYTPHC